MRCEWCFNELSEDEIEYPRLEGEPICDDCYHDEYEFICIKCGEYASKEEKSVVGGLFVILDEDEYNTRIGIYEIISLPYYGGEMLDLSLNTGSVEVLTRNTYGLEDNDLQEDAGHLCLKCSEKIKELVWKERRCLIQKERW